MNEIVISEIDQIISDCAKRDLVPSAEIIDRLLDLRNTVESSVLDEPVAI